jgi:hypothetical protein
MPARWHGRPGRLEVWYATLTDPRTGEGFWVHHELVAPRDGGAPRRQGWAAAFPPDAPPRHGRFTGDASAGPGPGLALFATRGAVVRDGALQGEAGELRWDLRYDDGGAPPLHTFPRAAWRRELLPAAHAVAAPTARFSGTFAVDGRTVELEDAPGAVARIYGHGNANRWGWAHADLPGGDVLEIVAAVSRRAGLDRLAPLSFVQLRERGRDWPRRPLAAAPLLRTDLRADGFTTAGVVGRRRLRADVRLDPERSLSLDYDDPDPPGPTCTNSERARCELVLERRTAGGWRTERAELLAATAHAEVGFRRAP